MESLPGVGDIIKTARMRRGMSQEQLAKEVDATRGWISLVELGQIKKPDSDRLRSIATILEVPADNILAAAGYKGATPVPMKQRPISDLIRELHGRIDEVVNIERAILFQNSHRAASPYERQESRASQDDNASGRGRFSFPRVREMQPA